MTTNKQIIIAFAAGVAVAIGAHVYEASLVYPPLPESLSDCKGFSFHPDCKNQAPRRN